MPKLKPDTIIPTPEEDAAINAGIALDPDASEWTDADFAKARAATMSRDVKVDVDVLQSAQAMSRDTRSRNQREGVYAGRIKGQHFRAHNPPTTWAGPRAALRPRPHVGRRSARESDEALLTYPVPSGSCAFCTYIRRMYPDSPKPRTPQQVKDAYRAAQASESMLSSSTSAPSTS